MNKAVWLCPGQFRFCKGGRSIKLLPTEHPFKIPLHFQLKYKEEVGKRTLYGIIPLQRSREIRRLELYHQIPNSGAAIDWARQMRAIRAGVNRLECGQRMTEVEDKGADGRIWKCQRQIDERRHFRKLSIRTCSVFFGCCLVLRDLLYLLYECSVRTFVDQASYEPQMTRRTVHYWGKKFRSLATSRIDHMATARIGTAGDIVELDECQVGRRKHNHRRTPRAVWLFGAIVRSSNPPSFFLEAVRGRNRVTLEEIITHRIPRQAKIMSDGWSAYDGLHLLGYEHGMVIHSKNFDSPEDPSVLTHTLENP
jgi:hypothetical protein